MSLSPIAPTSSTTKPFWFKKDSLAAWILIGLVGIGVLYGWGMIAGFVLNMLVDTTHIVMLVGGGVVGFLVLTNWRTRMGFRLFMRACTSYLINIDPIGILKDHLLEMKKRRDVMNEQIGNVRGSKQRLEDIIGKNQQSIANEMRQAEQAKVMGRAAKSADEQQRMALQVQLHGNTAGRLTQSNIAYSTLLTNGGHPNERALLPQR